MIRFDKFTQKAQEAVQRSQALASEAGQQQVHPVHLLVALAEEQDGVVGAVLSKCGIVANVVAEDARKLFNDIPQVQGAQGGTHLSPALGSIFQSAQQQTRGLGDVLHATEDVPRTTQRVEAVQQLRYVGFVGPLTGIHEADAERVGRRQLSVRLTREL